MTLTCITLKLKIVEIKLMNDYFFLSITLRSLLQTRTDNKSDFCHKLLKINNKYKNNGILLSKLDCCYYNCIKVKVNIV